MGAEVLSAWGRSPFAVGQGMDPELLRCEGQVRYLLVRGTRDGSSVAAVGAIWVSEDGRRGGVVPNPNSSWAAAELVRNHDGALERGWSPERIFDYWRDTRDEPWGLDIDPPQVAETLRALTARVEAA